MVVSIDTVLLGIIAICALILTIHFT